MLLIIYIYIKIIYQKNNNLNYIIYLKNIIYKTVPKIILKITSTT